MDPGRMFFRTITGSVPAARDRNWPPSSPRASQPRVLVRITDLPREGCPVPWGSWVDRAAEAGSSPKTEESLASARRPSSSRWGPPRTQPMVGGVATPSGQGYWLVSSDGGVFGFGERYLP